MRCVTVALAAALGLGCANNSGAVIVADAALSDDRPTAVDAPADRAAPDVSSALDVPALPATDAPAGDVSLFADGGRVPVCLPCTRNEDCGNDGACVAVSSGARACLPRCNPDVPVCPGRLRCVRDVALADTAVCAPVGGPCCIDADGDGYGVGVGCMGADCDDADMAVNPAATETCNRRDDNCNRTVDEGLARACTTACGMGMQTCFDGAFTACTARAPTTEVCGNNTDDDCDGMTDEMCGAMVCAANSTRPCYPGPTGTQGVGACRAGVERCAGDGSAWGTCTGAVVPTSEACGNGVDENCNGMADEGCTTGSCAPAPVRWELPRGTTGGPSCITTGGGYCEGTGHCSGSSCRSTPPGGCGEPHCGTLRCNDGSYSRERYCTVIAACQGGGIVATGFTW
jgi:hypothetical protein